MIRVILFASCVSLARGATFVGELLPGGVAPRGAQVLGAHFAYDAAHADFDAWRKRSTHLLEWEEARPFTRAQGAVAPESAVSPVAAVSPWPAVAPGAAVSPGAAISPGADVSPWPAVAPFGASAPASAAVPTPWYLAAIGSAGQAANATLYLLDLCPSVVLVKYAPLKCEAGSKSSLVRMRMPHLMGSVHVMIFSGHGTSLLFTSTPQNKKDENQKTM